MYEFRQVDDVVLMNDHAVLNEDDYKSERELRYALQDIGRDLCCPECGSINLTSNRAYAEYSRVRLYKETAAPGLFGTTYIEKKHLGDGWRFHGVFLRGKLLNQAYIRCKNCKWKCVDEDVAVMRTVVKAGVAVALVFGIR